MRRTVLRMAMAIAVTLYSFDAVAIPMIPEEGLAAEGRQEWQQAIFVYLSQLQKTPHRIDLWLRVASIEHQLKQFPLTIDAYQHAVMLCPNDPTLYKILSEVYAESNQPKEALVSINNAVERSPNNIEYLMARAQIANWNKALPIALDSEKRLLALTQSGQGTMAPIDLLINIGSLENQLQHYPAALAAYQQALQINPNDERAIRGVMLGKRLVLLPEKNRIASPDSPVQKHLNPVMSDEEAMLNVAHTLAWKGKTDAAIDAYEQCLRAHPNLAEAWLQYAEVLSWTSRYIDALDAIHHYEQIKGRTPRYFEKQARLLAMIGRYQSALSMNAPLVHASPNDPYLLSTQVIGLTRALQIDKALVYLDKAIRFGSNDPQVNGLKDITLTPLRSNISLEADYTAASDTTRIVDLPIYGQYFLSPSTSLLFQGLYERASAAPRSRLGPVDENRNAISDDSAKVGFTKQIEGFNLKGLAGALHIQGKNNHGIYDASLNTNAGQTAIINIQTLHDLYRPYLVPQTPKLISLQIMETRVGTYLQWQPFVQKYLNVAASYSDLTNNNSYGHLNVWPKARVYGSEHWLMTVGVDGDFWQFRRRATDGYYSPLHFDGYEGTVELYYAQSENVGYSVSGGFGMQKDETFPHYFYEEDLAMQVFVGIFTDWQLQAKAGYTLRDNPLGNYHCWTAGLVLTRRFK